MSKKILIGCIFLAVSFFAAPVFSADYSGMSTSELAQLRGTMGNDTSEEQEAFRLEWQKRVAGVETGEIKRQRNSNRTAKGSGKENNYRFSGSKERGACTTGESRIRTSTASHSRDLGQNSLSQSGQDRSGQGGCIQ